MAGAGVPGAGGEEQPIDLNLTALMDILSNLLFFLLASFGATVISTVSASVPVTSVDEGDTAKSEDAVTATVAIGRDGYQLTASSDTLEPEQLAALAATFPRTEKPVAGSKLNALDFARLTDALAHVKAEYPRSETLILVPEPTVKYDEVVKTMDAAREQVETDASGTAVKRPVFAKVVVTTTIQ